MVYLQQWHEYAAGVRAMQESRGGQLRFCSRWRHSKGVLTLKVTDDRQCLQFRTRSALYLNRFQLLVHEVMASMQSKTAVKGETMDGTMQAVPAEIGLSNVPGGEQAALEAESASSKAATTGVAKKKKSSKKRKN